MFYFIVKFNDCFHYFCARTIWYLLCIKSSDIFIFLVSYYYLLRIIWVFNNFFFMCMIFVVHSFTDGFIICILFLLLCFWMFIFMAITKNEEEYKMKIIVKHLYWRVRAVDCNCAEYLIFLCYVGHVD